MLKKDEIINFLDLVLPIAANDIKEKNLETTLYDFINHISDFINDKKLPNVIILFTLYTLLSYYVQDGIDCLSNYDTD